MTRRRASIAVGSILAVAAALAWFAWVVPARQAVAMGAGMLAKQMCSCIHVAGRTPEACRQDQMESLDPIRVDLETEPSAVRAFIPLLGERRAVHRPGFGCTLE